jgi:mucin-19
MKRIVATTAIALLSSASAYASDRCSSGTSVTIDTVGALGGSPAIDNCIIAQNGFTLTLDPLYGADYPYYFGYSYLAGDVILVQATGATINAVDYAHTVSNTSYAALKVSSGASVTINSVGTFINVNKTGGYAVYNEGEIVSYTASSTAGRGDLISQYGSGLYNAVGATIGSLNLGSSTNISAGTQGGVDDSNSAIVNYGSIGLIDVAGSIYAGGSGINNYGTINDLILRAGGSIGNDAVFDPSYTNVLGLGNAIKNSGTITSITNMGSFYSNDGSYNDVLSHILNNGTLGTLNNRQNSLRLEGALPLNYNIIISSTSSYGVLTADGAGVSGTMSFGIYGGDVTGIVASAVEEAIYENVLVGFTSSNMRWSWLAGQVGSRVKV